MNSLIEHEKETAYLRARRSLILGPVSNSEESVGEFLKDKMSVDEDTADGINLVELSKVHAKKLPIHRREKEEKSSGRVRICFADAHDRDVIMSHASSLTKGCSTEAVIPEHLAPLQRHLESYAFKIRKNGRNGGKKVSTSVRLQDDGMTLALALKTEGTNRWSYFSKEELKKNNDKVQKEEEESRRRRQERVKRSREEEGEEMGESDCGEEDDLMDDEEAGEMEEEMGEYGSAEEEEVRAQ